MSRPQSRLVLILCIALSGNGWSDVAGSRDPIDFPRYPRAEIISFSSDAEPREHEFIVSHVEKIRRDLKVADEVRVNARETVAIYQIPAETPLETVIAHYRKVVAVNDVRFSCRGRDCGRSAQWANQVFGQAILYGPDADQFYLAGQRAEGLVSLYVIERGNRRVLVMIRLLATGDSVAASSGLRMVQTLGSQGHVVVKGATPAVSGTLPAKTVEVLQDIGRHLGTLRKETIYVVCHLYAPGPAEATIKRSSACAEAATLALKGEGETAGGPTLVPFGAGPLLPREERLGRIELVLPHRRVTD